jgi:hypothetical protein
MSMPTRSPANFDEGAVGEISISFVDFILLWHKTRMCNMTELSQSISEHQRFVTIGGECFQLVRQGNIEPFIRDGELHKFHVIDCKRDRGNRLVSVFVAFSPSEQPNPQEYIAVACLNTIRRAMDSGELSFDLPYEQNRYKELSLDPSRFAAKKKANSQEIIAFLKNTAYWLGFHSSPSIDRYFVRFDLPQDLDYLGANPDDIRRSLWRLEREGLLEKSEIPGNFVPSLRLVDEFELVITSRQAEPQTSLQQLPEELQIFISHSSVDKLIATALTELLKNALVIAPEAIRCSSVDGHRLAVGAKTDETVKEELLNAKSFIALLTQKSLNSTWVLFELGARWGADLHLAPVLAAGLTTEQLRGPLPGINGLSCDSNNQVHQLVNDIAKVLKVEVRESHLYSNYVNMLMKASAEAAERGYLDHTSPEAGPENENLELKRRLASTGNSTEGTGSKLLADLISELEGNLETAKYFYSGPPGSRVYLPPSIQCWKSVRNELPFLDDGVLNDLKQIYTQTERWSGIVSSGIKPGIGSPEINEITTRLKMTLPALLTRLENVKNKRAPLEKAGDKLKPRPFGAATYYAREGEDIPYCPTCYGAKGHEIPLPAGEDWEGGFRRRCPACRNFFYERPMSRAESFKPRSN